MLVSIHKSKAKIFQEAKIYILFYRRFSPGYDVPPFQGGGCVLWGGVIPRVRPGA